MLEICQSSHCISNASSHIQYSHNLLSLLNRSLISLNSAEWTEMLEICICSPYRSPILLPGCIFIVQFLSFSFDFSSTFQQAFRCCTTRVAWDFLFVFRNMRRYFVELAALQLHFCWNGFTGTETLSGFPSPRVEQLAKHVLKCCWFVKCSFILLSLSMGITRHLPPPWQKKQPELSTFPCRSPLDLLWVLYIFRY